jgi:hypothetical protein
MAAVLARARAELRTRWRSWVGLALAVGVAGGAVLALAAGARRTDSAYPRLVAAERPPEVNSMLVEGIGERGITLDPAEVARLPQVAGVGRLREFPVFDGSTGEGVAIRNPEYVQAATFGGEAARWLERTKLLSGRLADPARADEAVIDFPLAERFGLGIGEVLRLRFVRPGEDELWASNETPPTSAGKPVSLRIVGIIAPTGASLRGPRGPGPDRSCSPPPSRRATVPAWAGGSR